MRQALADPSEGTASSAADCAQCQPAVLDARPIVRALRLAGHQVTPPRQVVIDAAVAHGRPFTAGELCASVAAAAPGVGRATVFRTLDLLAAERVVDRLHAAGGEQRYVLRDPERPEGPRHYLVCSACDRVTTLEDPELARTLASVTSRAAFQPETQLVEIVGRCRNC